MASVNHPCHSRPHVRLGRPQLGVSLVTGLSRRQFLAAGGGVTLAALAGCSSPVATSLTGGQPKTADVIYWHLFGGGDGANMATMVENFRESSAASVESTLLSWGNPFYTKLSLSTRSEEHTSELQSRQYLVC